MYNHTRLYKAEKKNRLLSSLSMKYPGKILKKRIEKLGMSQKAFAKHLGMFPGHLNDLINAKRAMSIPIALRLEKVLGTDAAFWMKLQIDYDIELARDDEYIKKILSKANPVK